MSSWRLHFFRCSRCFGPACNVLYLSFLFGTLYAHVCVVAALSALPPYKQSSCGSGRGPQIQLQFCTAIIHKATSLTSLGEKHADLVWPDYYSLLDHAWLLLQAVPANIVTCIYTSDGCIIISIHDVVFRYEIR